METWRTRPRPRQRVGCSTGRFARWVPLGGLISYQADSSLRTHRAAQYVDKIFKGANPANLPVEQPTKFNLEINLKTAKALGITFPPSILLRATKVIE